MANQGWTHANIQVPGCPGDHDSGRCRSDRHGLFQRAGRGRLQGGDKDTFVFAGAGDPGSLDPALASDGETFRVTRQAFEALLEHEPGGSKLVGGLAEKWSSDPAGKVWTFNLRQGVKFHDGEALNAAAVCANYDHWFNWKGTYQSSAVSYYWQTIMGGFAKNEDAEAPKPNYKSCTAKDDNTAVIEVNEPSANLPGGFSSRRWRSTRRRPSRSTRSRTRPPRATRSRTPSTARRPARSPAPARTRSRSGTRATRKSPSRASTATGATRPR